MRKYQLSLILQGVQGKKLGGIIIISNLNTTE